MAFNHTQRLCNGIFTSGCWSLQIKWSNGLKTLKPPCLSLNGALHLLFTVRLYNRLFTSVAPQAKSQWPHLDWGKFHLHTQWPGLLPLPTSHLWRSYSSIYNAQILLAVLDIFPLKHVFQSVVSIMRVKKNNTLEDRFSVFTLLLEQASWTEQAFYTLNNGDKSCCWFLRPFRALMAAVYEAQTEMASTFCPVMWANNSRALADW